MSLVLRLTSPSASADASPLGTLRAIATTGTAVALVGLAGFGTVHAFAIVPIWDRLGRGIIPAMLAGLTQAWAFEWTRRKNGALFGLTMFAILIPATVFSNALRLAGLPAGDWPATAAALALTLASGAVAGRVAAVERRGILSDVAAAGGLIVASAGPIPVANGVPAAYLFAGMLPILVAAGIVLSTVRARLQA
jgi:hypothetical protein